MQEIISALPALSALIEKGGIVGVMLIAIAVLVYERVRLSKELTSTYRQRDKWRLGYVICKQACDAAGLHPDLSQLSDLTEVTP